MKPLGWIQYGSISGIFVLTFIVALAETQVHSKLARFACPNHCKINLSPFSFQLYPFSRRTTRGRWEADSLSLAMGWSGVELTVHNLHVNSKPSPTPDSESESNLRSKTTTKSKVEKQTLSPQKDKGHIVDQLLLRISSLNRRLGRVPTQVQIDGQLRVLSHQHFGVELQQLTLNRDSSGNLNIESIALIQGVKPSEHLKISASLGPIAPLPEHPPFPAIPLSIDSRSSAYPFRFVAALDPDALRVQGTMTTEEGRADFGLQFRRHHQHHLIPDRFEFDAEQLELKSLHPLVEKFANYGLNIDLGSGLLNGNFSVQSSVDFSEFTINANNLSIKNLALQNRYLADQPILLRELRFTGALHKSPDQTRLKGSIHHQDAVLHVDHRQSKNSVELKLQLLEIDCQSLFQSIPQEFIPTLTGMELRGRFSGELQLQYSQSDLEKIRRDPLTEAAGKLEFDFPFLDQCEVVQEPSAINFRALNDVYRHHFLSAAGKEQVRLLGAENSDYVRRSKVPKLVLAFVILEDAQFWKHDGFDRDQMQRAFWHNLVQSRFSRGASTISQQTARNLWLGASRSLSRKVQEALLTSRLEHHVSKSKIAELYLNLIELGPEIHGVASASQFHFGLRPEKLSMIQALHLASMAPAPVGYSKKWVSGKVDDEWMKTLRNQLRRMLLRGLLSRSEFQTEARRPLNLLDRTQ